MEKKLDLVCLTLKQVLVKNVTKKQAERWIRKNCPPARGFTLSITEREPWLVEVNGGPPGWVWSSYYTY